MRPGLHSETQSDAATLHTIVRFRDQLLAEGHDPQSVGIAMISIGAGALCGLCKMAVYPAPENGVTASGPQVAAATRRDPIFAGERQ
jgi:hypothetical protein